MRKSLLLLVTVLSTFVVHAQSEATYQVTFTSNWTQAAHPHSSGNLPSNAHWSKLVGATHNDQVVFLEMGELATQGVENIAEQGNNAVFFSEVNDAINSDYASTLIDGSSLGSAEGQIVINDIVTSDDYPLLTLLSMIAPSPDWMIAVNSVPLIDGNGDWIDQIDIDLYPYDAGTDSGVDYTSPNNDTNPQEPISSLQGETPFSSEIIGTLSITLVNVLGNEDVIKNDVVIYPNPTNKDLNISSSSVITGLRLYNALGAEVISRNSVDANSAIIYLGRLPSGIYLLKIDAAENGVSVHRIVKR